MSDLAYAGTNGADQSAPAAAPKKPLDWEKTIESMLGELTFVDGHLQSLRFTLEMLRHMEGGERIKALEVAHFAAAELQHFASSAEFEVTEFCVAARREARDD
jgi:hypothetical protein